LRQIVPEAPSFRPKWTRGVPQVIQCLLCKCEAQSSNPSPTKKRKEKETGLKTAPVSFQSPQLRRTGRGAPHPTAPRLLLYTHSPIPLTSPQRAKGTVIFARAIVCSVPQPHFTPQTPPGPPNSAGQEHLSFSRRPG
jgi:hypothetical protein